MPTLPKTVQQAWADRDGPVILATVDDDGTPNIIYATCVAQSGEEHLVVADNYFDKTRRNILRGGRGALLFRTKSGKAFQVKGVLEYHRCG
ncbi:MAG: pyridoxamine 5'-phosphate oxidase family protein, partial [Lentisphaerae bacterium]|nr:pyridoxamine 5'-phosphate oxidase family protein [Lentisphaerota bacterium]